MEAKPIYDTICVAMETHAHVAGVSEKFVNGSRKDWQCWLLPELRHEPAVLTRNRHRDLISHLIGPDVFVERGTRQSDRLSCRVKRCALDEDRRSQIIDA